jgi:small ligand-binding sensory domain FIST
MKHPFAVSRRWHEDFSETGIQSWAKDLRQSLEAPEVSLGLLFVTPEFFEHAENLAEILQVHAKVPILVGCSSTGLICDSKEIEDTTGFVLSLFYFPGGKLIPFRFDQENVEEGNGPAYWHLETGLTPDNCNGWLVFSDPFTLDSDNWIRQWNEAYAPLPTVGGLASGDFSAQRTQLYLNGTVYESGGVAIGLSGDVGLACAISQGCTPIGETWTVTRTDNNFIQEIANRPAYQILVETFQKLTAEEQEKTRGNLFVGLVINEYAEELRRGDFLVRNVLGADPKTGTIAVGAVPRPGQTLQFQRRDAEAATEDMRALLSSLQKELKNVPVYGACLCCCNGRGYRLFGTPSHDAQLVQNLLGPITMSGFFCNGEIGPVGNRTFIHGYTASLGVFVKKSG